MYSKELDNSIFSNRHFSLRRLIKEQEEMRGEKCCVCVVVHTEHDSPSRVRPHNSAFSLANATRS